MEHVIGNK